MRHATARPGHPCDTTPSRVNGMGEPHVLPHPVEVLRVLEGWTAELPYAESLLILGFGKMGVQTDAVPAGQSRAFAHHLRGHREGRAGS